MDGNCGTYFRTSANFRANFCSALLTTLNYRQYVTIKNWRYWRLIGDSLNRLWLKPQQITRFIWYQVILMKLKKNKRSPH